MTAMGRGMLFLALLAAPLARADLKPALAEPNLEKRSKLALDNASDALKQARDAYEKGLADQVRERVAEISESVALTMKSLRDSGKNPRRSPKWFKRAEIGLRDLQRKVEAFQRDMSVDDRSQLEKLHGEVQEAHEELLTGLLEGHRK